MRFEMLMDSVSLIDKNLDVLDFIKDYSTPNLNHYNLANLAIEGHYVFTPNFDDLIERAIYNLGFIPKTICSKSDYESYSSLRGKTIPVFKLHGSYYTHTGGKVKKKRTKGSIQASLVSIISGNESLLLDDFKTDLLKKCIEKSEKLLFVGYSGCDDFDIIPSLMLIDINNILWINHNKQVCTDNVIERYLTEDNGRSHLLEKRYRIASDSVKFYDTNTREFLMSLGGIKDIPDGKSHKNSGFYRDYIINWASTLTGAEKSYIIGRIYQGMELYEKAVELYSKIECESDCYIASQQQMGSCLEQRSRYDEALRIYESLIKRENIEKAKEYLEIVAGRAYLTYRRYGPSNQEEASYKEVLRKAGKRHSLLQNTMNNYALLLADMGRTREAIYQYKKSYAYAVKQGDLQRQCWVASNIANSLYDIGEVNKAEKWVQKGMEKVELLGDHRQMGVFENTLANILYIRGEYDNAIEYCEKSIFRDKYIDNEPDSSVTEMLLGLCYFDQGDYKMANSHYGNSFKLFTLSDDKSYLYELVFYNIVLYLKLSDYKSINTMLMLFEENKSHNQRKTDMLFYKVAAKMVKYFVSDKNVSFKEDLQILIGDKDNKEVIAYINIIWYLSSLGIPLYAIGKRNVKKASIYYRRYGNLMKSEVLNSLT